MSKLKEWFERAESGTSGDQVHDILYDWEASNKKYASRIKELEKENTAWQNQNLLEQCNDQADRIKELEAQIKDMCKQQMAMAEEIGTLSGTTEEH